MALQFNFNLSKAVDVTSLILSKINSNEVDVLKLLKHIYLIDRCALKQIGYPIVGGEYVLIKGVPVIYDLYKVLFWFWSKEPPEDVAKNQKVWSNYFHISTSTPRQPTISPKITEEEKISIFEDLSEEEINVVLNTLPHFGKVYHFPETEELINHQTIDNVKLLKFLDKTYEEIEELERLAARENYLDAKLKK